MVTTFEATDPIALFRGFKKARFPKIMKSRWLLHGLILFISLVHSSSYAVSDLSTNRQRFSIADVSLRLLWVPEPMDESVKESFVTACRVFLDGHLNVAPTTIINLQVAVGSQELDNLHSVANDSIFPLSANIEVLVEYYIDPGDANIGEMERRIKTLFMVEWEEFLALLLLLDPAFFSPIQRIFLEASLDHIAPSPSPPVTLQRTETNTASSTIVVVFIVVAVGVVLSLATIPVFCKQSKSRNPGCNPTITTSSTNDECVQSRDGRKSVMSGEMEYTDNARDAIQSIYSDDKISSYSSRNLRSQKSNSQDKFQQTMSGFKSVFRISSSEGPPQKGKPPMEKPAKAAKRADVEISRVSTQSSTENQSSLEDHVVPVIPTPAVSKPVPVAPKPAPVAPKKGNSQDKFQQTRSGFKSSFRIPSGEGPPQKEMPPMEKPQRAKAAKRADVEIGRVTKQFSTENQSSDHQVAPVMIPIPALSKPVPVAPKPAPVSRKPQVQPPSQPTPVVVPVLLHQQYHPPPAPKPHWVTSSDASSIYSMSTISCGGAFDEEEAQPGTLLGDDRTIETIQTRRRAEYTSNDDFGSIAGSQPKPKKAIRKRTEAAWSRDIKNGIVLKPREPTQKSPDPDASKVVGSVISTVPQLKPNLSTLYSGDDDEDDDFGSIAGSLPKPEKSTRRRIEL